jgi:hypothetical protein
MRGLMVQSFTVIVNAYLVGPARDSINSIKRKNGKLFALTGPKVCIALEHCPYH